MTATLKIVRWLWGEDLGKVVRVKSWRPGLDGRYLAWPTLVVDKWSCRVTVTPIWNRAWLRARLGFKEPPPSRGAVMGNITIKTRDQLGRYLQREAEKMCRLHYDRSVLRELVEDAYKLRGRMPTEWRDRAKQALDATKER